MAYGQENNQLIEIFEEEFSKLNETINSNQKYLTTKISGIENQIRNESSDIRNLEQTVRQGDSSIITTFNAHSEDAKKYSFIGIGIATAA